MPVRSLPLESSAVYSNAPNSILARHPQHFFERGFAAQHLRPSVVADRRRRQAGVALELLFAYPVMNHGAHRVVDDDELVDTRAPTITAGSVAAGPVEHGRGLISRHIEQTPLILSCLERLFALGVEHAHQALREHADQARGEQEGLDA